MLTIISGDLVKALEEMTKSEWGSNFIRFPEVNSVSGLPLIPAEQFELGMFHAKNSGDLGEVLVLTYSDLYFNGVRVAVYELGLDPASILFLHFHADGRFESPSIDRIGRMNFYPKGFFLEVSGNAVDRLLVKKG